MNLKQELKKKSTLLVVNISEKYNEVITKVLKELSSYSLHYITLNKTHQAITDSMKKNNISPKGICFIDGITNVAMKGAKNTKGCAFLKAPNSLKEMETHILNDKHNHEVIILDSLSTLLIYEKVDVVARFVINLLQKIKSKKSVFLILKGDKETELIEKIKQSFDKTIEFK